MNSSIPSTLLLLAVLTLADSGPRAIAAAFDANAEKQAIGLIVEQYCAAVAGKDLQKTIEPYAPDAILMPAGAPAAKGTDAIRAFYASFLKRAGLSISITPERTDFSSAGDMAVDMGRVEVEFDASDSQRRVRYVSKYLLVWRKVEGQWLIVYDMWNSNGQQAN
jgi:uncharacterized protein (TIGR02246 family)